MKKISSLLMVAAAAFMVSCGGNAQKAAPAEETAKKLPVAVQLYSVRGDMEADFKGTLQKIKALGFDGVEFAGLFENDPAQVNAWCKEIGLNPISAHVPLADM